MGKKTKSNFYGPLQYPKGFERAAQEKHFKPDTLRRDAYGRLYVSGQFEGQETTVKILLGDNLKDNRSLLERTKKNTADIERQKKLRIAEANKEFAAERAAQAKKVQKSAGPTKVVDMEGKPYIPSGKAPDAPVHAEVARLREAFPPISVRQKSIWAVCEGPDRIPVAIQIKSGWGDEERQKNILHSLRSKIGGKFRVRGNYPIEQWREVEAISHSKAIDAFRAERGMLVSSPPAIIKAVVSSAVFGEPVIEVGLTRYRNMVVNNLIAAGSELFRALGEENDGVRRTLLRSGYEDVPSPRAQLG